MKADIRFTNLTPKLLQSAVGIVIQQMYTALKICWVFASLQKLISKTCFSVLNSSYHNQTVITVPTKGQTNIQQKTKSEKGSFLRLCSTSWYQKSWLLSLFGREESVIFRCNRNNTIKDTDKKPQSATLEFSLRRISPKTLNITVYLTNINKFTANHVCLEVWISRIWKISLSPLMSWHL